LTNLHARTASWCLVSGLVGFLIVGIGVVAGVEVVWGAEAPLEEVVAAGAAPAPPELFELLPHPDASTAATSASASVIVSDGSRCMVDLLCGCARM